MERPHRFNLELALFLADSLEISERLAMLNQKLQAVIETIPHSPNGMQVKIEPPKYLSGDHGLLEGSVGSLR